MKKKYRISYFILVVALISRGLCANGYFLDTNRKEDNLVSENYIQKTTLKSRTYEVIGGKDIIDNAVVIEKSELSNKPIIIEANSNNKKDADDTIFLINTDKITLKSEVSANILDGFLKGTNLYGLGEAFKKAEEDYDINAIFLVGLALHESNGGKSRIALEKNNIFGFQAYDSSPYRSSKKFSSREECIDIVAKYLSKNYLSVNGRYFEGYSIEALNIHYATDPDWGKGIKMNIYNKFMKI
ncbi:MAG: glucosaminidase domain-containing protein [Filifactoraceae bacterium]